MTTQRLLFALPAAALLAFACRSPSSVATLEPGELFATVTLQFET